MRVPWWSMCFVALAGCGQRGEAEVLLGFVDAADVDALVGVRARVTLTDADGGHPLATLQVPGADAVAVEALDIPLPCEAAGCRGRLLIEPGRYDVDVTLSALDRCNSRGDVARFRGDVDVDPWAVATSVLTLTQTDFDVDGDGVFDIFEAGRCGRFDFAEGASAPHACAPGHDACCMAASLLTGGQMLFSGGDVALPYDRDEVAGDDVVSVGAFALDSTEFTYGALERCILAGACLSGRPGHPVRRRLAIGVDPRLPVQGLTPAEAAEACAWLGRRLPTDAQWHAAAALRPDGAAAVYPFDLDDRAVVGCEPDDPPPAARHAAAGRSCGDGQPLPVGSFAQTVVNRGEGTPVADLAGNVAEWTVVGDPTRIDADDDGVPDGATAIVLRGGGSSSILPLLENGLPIIFDLADPVDADRLRQTVVVAGFRCVADAVSPATIEPVCPAGNASEYVAP